MATSISDCSARGATFISGLQSIEIVVPVVLPELLMNPKVDDGNKMILSLFPLSPL
mgnify:CR=1 FL=1